MTLAGRVLALAAVGALLALLAYGLTTKASRDGIKQRLAEGRAATAPAFELPVLQPGSGARLGRQLGDDKLGLAELRDRPVVLNFWASWCPPCRTETPRLERGWQDARGRGVVFLGLNMQDVTSDAKDFLDEFEVTYPNVRDQGNGVATDWGVSGLPETFFLRRDGRIVGHVVGEISDDQLDRGVKATLSGRVVGSLAGGDRRSTR